MGLEKPTSLVEDPEEARRAAEAEKPFRDAAREEGASPEEKAVLDRVAEKKGGRVIADINAEKERKLAEEERKLFVGHENVNGIEIVVDWESRYNDYVIEFPQMEIGPESRGKGVDDRMMRITRNPDVAKLVFDYACYLAKAVPDVYELYKRIDKFSRDLPYEDQE